MSIPSAAEARETSNTYSDCIDAIEPDLFEWSSRREKLDRAFDRAAREGREAAAGLPDGWELKAKAQFVFGRVMGSETLARRFVKSIRDNHPRHTQTLAYMVAHPWRYALFRVEDRLGENLLRARDHQRDESLVLHSETVTRLHREGHRLFFSLIGSNPVCYQTYGAVYMFNGFTPEDFECFAALLDSALFDNGGLEAVMGRYPVSFYLLYTFSAMPSVGHDNRRIVYCASQVSDTEFDPDKAAIAAPSERKDGVTHWNLCGETTPFQFANLYWDDHKLTLMTSSVEEYGEARGRLGESVGLPADPQFRAGMLMVLAVEKILGVPFPGTEYDEIFAVEITAEESESVDRYNLFFKDLSEARNFGRSYDPVDLARRHGLSEEEAGQIEREMQRLDDKYAFVIEGGIEGYEPPAPGIRRRLTTTLTTCDLFELAEDDMAAELLKAYRPEYQPVLKNTGHKTIELTDLGNYLEELFFDLWQQTSPIIFTYTLWLLKTEGRRYRKVKDYAIEVLKTFGQVLVPRDNTEAIEDFVDFFGYFCFYALESFGLIEIQGEPTQRQIDHAGYRIRTGPLFRLWIKWIE